MTVHEQCRRLLTAGVDVDMLVLVFPLTLWPDATSAWGIPIIHPEGVTEPMLAQRLTLMPSATSVRLEQSTGLWQKCTACTAMVNPVQPECRCNR